MQKCEFRMESTTTVLSRNANLAVKGLNDFDVHYFMEMLFL